MADNPVSAVIDVIDAHVKSDPAFSAIDLVRKTWPRREHHVLGSIAVTQPAGTMRSDGVSSTGEDKWIWPMETLFGIQLTDNEEGNVIAVLMKLAYSLMVDFRAKTPLLVTAVLPATSKYQRTLVQSINLNPSPYADNPNTHAVSVSFEFHTCEMRST